jgi:hypothetical protein
MARSEAKDGCDVDQFGDAMAAPYRSQFFDPKIFNSQELTLVVGYHRIPIKATAREPIKQAGYISATSAIQVQTLLRNAAGPYKSAISGSYSIAPVPRTSTWLRWSFEQPGLPRSFLV